MSEGAALVRRWAVLVAVLALVGSAAAQRTIEVQPASGAAGVGVYGESWAVVIGIDDYQHPRVPKLRYAVNDARAVERTLRALGFRSDRIVTLLDRQATKAAIEQIVGDDLRAKVGPNDRVLVFFAGHGKTDRLRSGEEEGYLIAADSDPSRLFSSAISMTALRQISDRLPAKHILYVVDACYSGYAVFNRAISDDLLEEMIRKPAIQILTAGRQGDQAQERGGHGVFTEVLLRGLGGEAFAGKGWLALEELGVWVKQRVYAESNRKQLPQFGNLSGEGQFVFLRAGARLAGAPAPAEPARPVPTLVPRQELGSLSITSRIPGVEVWLGEQRIGETRPGADMLVSNLAAGPHRVVAKKGTRTWERTVEVGATDKTTLAIELDLAAPGRLALLSEVFAIVDAQYVEPPDYARFRLGGFRGLEGVVAQPAFRVEEQRDGAAIAFRARGEATTRIVFAPPLIRDDALNDMLFAHRLAHDVAAGDPGRLEQSMIARAVSSLDPHSSFLDAESYREMQVETSGSFGGLGIEITLRDEMLTVVAPIEGTPAHRAGLRPGDRILAIDGAATKDLTLAAAVKRLRGRPGTKVVIRVGREGWASPREFEITREQIRVHSVLSRELEPGIGYIKIRQFQEKTPADLEAALKQWAGSWWGGGRLRALVLDLRNNPGGLLTSSVETAEKFLDGGKLVVYTQGRISNQNMRLSTAKAGSTGFPMVVLVNQGSASASEILASALKDWNRAVVVGERTFGKGSIQTIIPLSDGSALRLTTAQYFTPKGRAIHGQGLTPDLLVEEPKAPAEKSAPPPLDPSEALKTDVQFQRALAHLKTLLGPGRR